MNTYQHTCPGGPLDGIRHLHVLDGKGADRRDDLHRLFMYPAMMVPKIQQIILRSLSHLIPEGARVIDPFMGSGTSLITCMEFGYNIYGQDINPFAVLLTKAKTNIQPTEEYFNILSKIEISIAKDNSDTIDVNFYNIDHWFTKRAQIDFSKIRRAIIAIENPNIRYFFWIMMAETIRTGCNDRTSTFKLHRRSDEEIALRDIDVINNFLIYSKRGIEDLRNFKKKLIDANKWRNEHYVGDISIQWGNSQHSINCTDKFDLLVSSPPYGDNHTTVTYGQTSYLPLQWIDPRDLECGYDYLRTTQEIDAQSIGGKKLKITGIERLNKLLDRVPTLKNFIESIPIEERPKYKKTIAFIRDFDDCLKNIVDSMAPNAYYVWTIGNRFVGGREIPNDKILIDLMASYGLYILDHADRQILNKKQPRKNNYSRTMEKERILIFHKTERTE